MRELQSAADTYDLGGGTECDAEVLHDRCPESDALFECDVGSVGAARQAILSAENQDLQPSAVEQVDRVPGDLRGQHMFGHGRQVGTGHHASIETGHWGRDTKRPNRKSLPSI